MSYTFSRTLRYQPRSQSPLTRLKARAAYRPLTLLGAGGRPVSKPQNQVCKRVDFLLARECQDYLNATHRLYEESKAASVPIRLDMQDAHLHRYSLRKGRATWTK